MKELLKKKGVRIGLLVIILLVAVGIIGTNAQSAQRREEYNGHIEAAEKYLSELDYEQAIAEYTLALEIEPKSEEVLSGLERTYLAYARSYADTGDYERAIDILEEGYAMIERESLKEQLEEYSKQQMMEQEAETEAETETESETEAAQDDDIKQMVESEEFQDKLGKLIEIFGGTHYITDEQVRELCWPMIEAMERYRELYPENGWYYFPLPYLYFLVGEYELCAQIRTELQKLFPDNSNLWSYYNDEGAETTRDEYGRVIMSTVVYPNQGKQVEEYEYGQNGKIIRTVGMNDSGRRGTETVITTWTREYEYDSEGRLSKMSYSQEDNPGGTSMSVLAYEYSEGGFTTYENAEGYHGDYRIISNYVIDEYGRAEMVGEPDIYREIQ